MITKEIFEKLNKKDREEYFREKSEVFKDYFPLRFTTTCIRWTIIIFALSLIVLPLWKLAFSLKIFISIGNMFIAIFQTMKLVIILGIFIDIMIILFKIHLIDKIKRKYFKIEIKRRKK
jgi:hypothetical protein